MAPGLTEWLTTARVDNLIYAAGLGRTDAVRHMLATGTGTDTIVAAMHGRLSTVCALLDGGVDVNATPYCRQSALHYAANLGRAEVIEELLARGADVSLLDTQMKQTPAGWAREMGNAEIAARLER
jgi:ankyrin repeat protein